MKQRLITLLEDPRTRKVLWVFLIALTIILLLHPISISLDHPLPVQSIYIFSNLSLFITLFYTWLFLLLVLLFSRKEQWLEGIALCLIFILVFVGFWALISPGGIAPDDIFHISHANYLKQEGEIPLGHPPFGYFDFPGLHLFATPLSFILGIDIFSTRTLFILINAFVFTLCLFATFLRLLKSPFYTSLGVILVVTSSITLANAIAIYHPGALGTTYLALFLLLLSRIKEGFGSRQEGAIFCLLVAAATIEYLFTPFFFFFGALGIYVLYHFFKEKPPLTFLVVLVPLLFVISWEIWWAYGTFERITSAWLIIWEDLKAGKFFLIPEQYLRANVGPIYPWWGDITRLFWWSFVFGFGTLLMGWKLLRFKRQENLEKIWLGGFAGVALTTFIGAIGTRGLVHGGFARYIWVAPFFIVPAILMLLSHSKFKNLSLLFLFLVLLLFPFPTFLTNMDTLSSHYIYQQEHSLGKFINSIYGRGIDLNLYYFAPLSIYFYSPDSKLIIPHPCGLEEREAWQRIDGTIEHFINSTRGVNLLIDSKKMKLLYQEWLGIPLVSPEWNAIEERLNYLNRIYENEIIRIYSP